MKKLKGPKIIRYCITDKWIKVRNGQSPDAHIKIVVVGVGFKSKSCQTS